MNQVHAALSYLVENRLAILAALGFLASCLVITMPPPNVPWDRQAFKTWFYDFTHAIVISKNTRLAPAPIPQAPLNTPAPAALPPAAAPGATSPSAKV